MTRKLCIIACAVILVVGNVICLCTLDKQNTELRDKVEFYEKVMEDFGIDEFIHYPDLYYNEGYVDQVKVHNCMWAFDLEM